MATIKINETNYYYELHGEGEQSLILIAGYTADHTFYEPLLEYLSKHYKVLVFDNRGVGQTKDSVSQVLSAELMANETIALAERLQLSNPHIVGQSMGGTIAQTIAANYPDKINKLVLLTTSSKWRTAMLFAFKSLLKMRENEFDFEVQFETVVPWLFGQAFISDPNELSNFKESILTAEFPQSIEDQKRQYQVLTQFDGRSQLKNITAETLIVYGKEDLIALPEESVYMKTYIPNSQLLAAPCGHVIVAEQPNFIAKSLLDFL